MALARFGASGSSLLFEARKFNRRLLFPRQPRLLLSLSPVNLWHSFLFRAIRASTPVQALESGRISAQVRSSVWRSTQAHFCRGTSHIPVIRRPCDVAFHSVQQFPLPPHPVTHHASHIMDSNTLCVATECREVDIGWGKNTPGNRYTTPEMIFT